MAWTDLKAAVAAVIKTNGNQEITGALLQSTLNSIIDQVGANPTFKGVAIPSTNPGTPDGPLFYIAYEKGVYANFNAINITEEDGLVIILYSSNWSKINIPLASKDELTQVRSDLSALNILADNLNDNINGDKIPILSKTSTTTYIDFSVDSNTISISKVFYIRCRNSDGSIPTSVNYQVRDSTSALGNGTITLDANGEGSYTINNVAATIFRLVNIAIGFVASIISDETTVSKRLDNLEDETSNYFPLITNNTEKLDILIPNINGDKIPVLTKTATTTYIDFSVDSSTISISKIFYIRCRNSDGSIPTSVSILLRDSTSAIGSGTITLDANGEGSYTIINGAVTIFRLVNINIGFVASIISDETTVGKRLDNLEDETSKLKYYKETFANGVIMEVGSTYENCIFKTNVKVNDYCIIKNCDIINCVLQPVNSYGISKAIISNNKFIGDNARIQVSGLYDCVIDSNDFEISDNRYPDAIAKTNGEFSRNIFTRVLARTRITNNHISIGRTGIIVLGSYNDHITQNLLEYSSCDNVISGNIIEGIGEEHISFDGSSVYDIGKITSSSVEFVEIDTGQLADGQTYNQTKIVARVTLSVTSQVLSVYPYSDGKHIKVYPSLAKPGFYGINIKNSKYYKVINVELSGTTNTDTDGLDYSVSGTYNVTIEIPTIYNFKRTMTTQNETDNIAAIMNDWSVNDIICIGGIQSKNVISENVIEGIGTDAISDIDDMGGIVLYGNCFHNVINSNFLRQKRIWLQQWNNATASYVSKIKMQSYNTISNNTLVDTSISLVNLNISGFNNSMIINRGNRIIGNIVSGFYDVAGINVAKEYDTLLMGNLARYYKLSDNDKLKLVANSKESSDKQVISNNTNVSSDSTDEILI